MASLITIKLVSLVVYTTLYLSLDIIENLMKMIVCMLIGDLLLFNYDTFIVGCCGTSSGWMECSPICLVSRVIAREHAERTSL